MTQYRLKAGQETIDIVDGEFAGKRFERGKTYTVIPENEAHRFETVGAKHVSPAPKAAEKTEPTDNTTAPYGLEPAEDPDRKNGFKIVKR